MAEEDLTLRMRARGARETSRDVDRASGSVRKLGDETDRSSRNAVRARGSFRLFSSGLRPVVTLATTAGAALGVMGIAGAAQMAVRASSDLNEEINKTKVVFRGNERQMISWSRTASDSFGQSQQQALEAAGVFGNMMVPMGFARDEAARMSRRMVGLASDMASFNNADPSEVLEALRAGLAGETEPLRRFGVFLNDARLKQQAMNMGLYKGKGNMTAQAKAAATYALILKDTKDAQGDFARTSGGLANQQRTLRAQVTDLAAELGTGLLPYVNKGVGALAGFVKGMRNGTGAGGQFRDTVSDIATDVAAFAGFLWDNRNALMAMAGGLLAGWAALKAFMLIQKVLRLVHLARGLYIAWRAGALAMAAAQLGLNVALWANPIGLVVAAVIGLVAAFVIAYKRIGWFRNAVNAAWGVLKYVPAIFVIRMLARLAGKVWEARGKIVGALSGIWDGLKSGLVSALNWAIDKVNWLIDKFNKLPGPDIGKIGRIQTGEPATGRLPGPVGAHRTEPAGARVPGAARGGVVSRGGLFEVGERGRELVELGAGDIVHPHERPVSRDELEDLVLPITLEMDGEVVAKKVVRVARKKKAVR